MFPFFTSIVGVALDNSTCNSYGYSLGVGDHYVYPNHRWRYD